MKISINNTLLFYNTTKEDTDFIIDLTLIIMKLRI